jgi:hypothetical protein
MSSRRTKLIAGISALFAGGGLAAGLTASSASAATLNVPRPVHHACAYNLNGFNILDLQFQGNTFKYPFFLSVANNGLINGILVDSGLPAGSQVLRVHGLCVGDNVILDVNYPVGDVQGSRSENMLITPDATHVHRGDVAGVWDENGTENGNGAASLERTVRAY